MRISPAKRNIDARLPCQVSVAHVTGAHTLECTTYMNLGSSMAALLYTRADRGAHDIYHAQQRLDGGAKYLQ
jgi:hypothetical protein